jgi:hypothetical protein
MLSSHLVDPHSSSQPRQQTSLLPHNAHVSHDPSMCPCASKRETPTSLGPQKATGQRDAHTRSPMQAQQHNQPGQDVPNVTAPAQTENPLQVGFVPKAVQGRASSQHALDTPTPPDTASKRHREPDSPSPPRPHQRNTSRLLPQAPLPPPSLLPLGGLHLGL